MRALAIFFGVLGAIYGLYKLQYPTYAYRYRMTVSVEVDGRVRSGASVIEGRVSTQPQFLPDVNRLQFRERGDAVFIDLGNNRNLVALLASGTFAERPGFDRLAPAHFKLRFRNSSELAALPKLRGSWALEPSDWPTLVTFSNPTDPATARMVKPEQFEEVFGPGVVWRGVTMEMTRDAISWGIDAHFPWVPQLKSRQRGSTYQTPGKFTLNGSYFRVGNWL